MSKSNAKEFVKQLLTALNGVTCPLDEPYKTHFEALKANYNSVLEGLPPSDMVPAAGEANWNLNSLLSCMMSAQNYITFLSGNLAEMKTKMGDALSSVNGKVTSMLEEKIKAGELVPKATVTSLCSEARLAGLEEGKKEIEIEIKKKDAVVKLIGERKALVVKNGLPLPEKDELLGGSEDEFSAAQTKAKNRVEALKGKGLSLNSALMSKAWLADSEFASFETLVGETLQAKKNAAEPFATGAGTASGNAVPGGMM